MPLLILLPSILVVYLLMRELSTRHVAVLAPLISLALHFPDPHPHILLLMVVIPLFYYALACYLKTPSTRNGVFLGLSWVFGGLTHVLGTFGIGMVLLSNVTFFF